MDDEKKIIDDDEIFSSEKNIKESPPKNIQEKSKLKIPKIGTRSKKTIKDPKSPIQIPRRAKISPPTIIKQEDMDESSKDDSVTIDQIYISNPIETVVLPASPIIKLDIPEEEIISINQPIHHFNNNAVITPAPPSSKKRSNIIPPPYSTPKRQSVKQEPIFPQVFNNNMNETLKEPETVDSFPNSFISDSEPLPDILKTSTNNNFPNLKNIPNYSSMPLEEQAQHRANFRARFGLLRDYWPSYHIPNIPDTLPLEEIHAQYDVYVRHIHISNDVDKYKIYLVIGWLIIEAFLHKLGLNIGGYTISQMRAMNKYEKLLIEMGETNYKKSAVDGSGAYTSYPVEIRIFFVALINAITFIAIKVLSTYIPSGTAEMVVETITSYLAGTPPQPGQTLFGNSETDTQKQSNNVHVQPLPENNSPFGGFDVASMIANFGSSFISKSNNQPQPTTQNSNNTPKYAPAYLE